MSDYNVSAEKIVSASVNYSNKNESGREWDINADATIQDGKVTGYTNGTIRRVSSDSSGNIPSGNFNAGENNSYFSITFSGATLDAKQDMLRHIHDFMQAVAQNITQYGTIAVTL